MPLPSGFAGQQESFCPSYAAQVANDAEGTITDVRSTWMQQLSMGHSLQCNVNYNLSMHSMQAVMCHQDTCFPPSLNVTSER